MKPRKPTPKQAERLAALFIEATAALLTRLGATEVIDYRQRFVIETIYGPLSVTPYDTWIACRFAEVPRVDRDQLGTRFNHYSGKWNFHFSSRASPEDLPVFEHELTQILIPEAITT